MTQTSIPAGNGPDASRSLAYAAFATAFTYPDREGLEVIRSGALANALQQLIGAIAPGLIADTDWAALQDAGPDDDALQMNFTRLFDVGENGPDCPLTGGSYNGPGMEALEELVRFYNFFGLSLDDTHQGAPDHLTTELEFLHYLTFQESQLAAAGEELEGILRAQRDFIVRHPGNWIPAMRQRLAAHDPLPYLAELARLLERFLQAEEHYLMERIGQYPDNAPPTSTSTLQ